MTAPQGGYERELAATAGEEPAPALAATAAPPRALVSGGDPLAVGLMAFALGTLTAGVSLVGVFPASALGGVVPIEAGFCGIALFTVSLWPLLPGESLLAATFGTVSGFFFSLALLVPFLRLPVIYPLTVVGVITLLALAASWVFTGSSNVQSAAGATTLATSFLLFWEWLNVTMTSAGMTKVPPLGQVLTI